MARAPKGKASKVAAAAAGAAAAAAKRRKKKVGGPPPAMRRSASASSASSTASPKADHGGDAPAVAVGSGAATPVTPSGHGKECEQCGNGMQLDGVTSSRAWPTGKKAGASTGCQICDFVAFRKSQRPCVHCRRASCDYFCDWCGHGFHAKCARARDENVGNPDGFSCRKCEAEQENPGDTSASEDEDEDELGARCGSCHLPFNHGGKKDADRERDVDGGGEQDADDDDGGGDAQASAGFRVNQSVLVDNEDMLYNALITAVDGKKERIKIHFIRWSKSFDDWYPMDDERINESLACDCCNQWFHIGCLPPIKSSGRWKESTYVCPACIEDARAFHNGNRAVLKAKTAYISTSQAIANSAGNRDKPTRRSASAASSSDERGSSEATATSAKAGGSRAKKSAKAAAERDDANEVASPAASGGATALAADKQAESSAAPGPKRKRKLSEVTSAVSESPMKKKDGLANAGKRPDLPVRHIEPVPEAPASRSDNAASEEPAAVDSASSATSAAPAAAAAAATTDAAKPAPEQPHASPEHTTVKTAEEVHSSPSKLVAEKAPSTPNKDAVAASANGQAPPSKSGEPDASHQRRGSGHSMSSLLNSPAPDEDRPQAVFKGSVTSMPMIIPHRSSGQASKAMSVLIKPGKDVAVKVERDLFPSGSRGTSAAKAATTSRSRPAASRGPKKNAGNGRGGLSAFDILREVATQSMSGDINDGPPAVKPKRERNPTPAQEASKRAKSDAATSTTSPAGTNSDVERLQQTRERIQMNSFVDLHFNIRKEMYLRFCRLEEEGLLARDTAHLLRALIYPTSDKFQDLKFVYLVNKDLPSDQLTKRLLEVVPGGKGPAALAASLLPPPSTGLHHSRPSPALSTMSLFPAGVPRNVSPAGTPRMGLLPHPPGATLTERLAESAIRSPLRSTVVSGPSPIPSGLKADVAASKEAASKRHLLERPQAPAPPPVSNQPGAPLISR